MQVKFVLILLCFSFCAWANYGQKVKSLSNDGVKNERPYYMDDVGVDEKLGESVDYDLGFLDTQSRQVTLKEILSGDGRPVFLMLAYYNCPTLCSLHFSSLMKSFRDFEWDVGKEFDFIVVSIDPREGPEDAKRARELYFSEYARSGVDINRWNFLTGSEENIQKLSRQVGFNYVWDPNMQQYAHPAVAYVLTPNGKISYYHYGLNIDPKVMRLSLVEAAENKVGNIVDRMMLFCLQYDPKKKTYAFYAFNIMRVVASSAAVLLLIFLARFWWRERGKEV